MAAAAKRLWNYFDGEPFLVNPHLGIINSPRKGKKKMARKHGRAHMAWVRSFKKNSGKRSRRRSRGLRNAYPVAGLVVNPRRRRRARRNPVLFARRRRGGYRRNPAVLGLAMPPLSQVVYAGVGFVAPPLVEGFLSRFIPAEFQTSTVGKYVVRIAAVLGLSYLAKQVSGSNEARMVAIGGGAYVLTTALRDFAPGLIPGMGMYVPSNLGQYVQSNGRAFTGLGAAPRAALPFPSSGAIPASAVAKRFQRF